MNITRPASRSATLERESSAPPPELLFHYTTPAGLLGIARSRELWASNVMCLNDHKEVEHAADYAKWAIGNLVQGSGYSGPERNLLEKMSESAATAARRYYIASFSAERDMLSQWRGYSPSGGGYSLGISSAHLRSIAHVQSFFLAPCIYEHRIKYQIASEIAHSYVEDYRSPTSETDESKVKRIAWEFGQHLARYGSMLKHHAFHEEREWRLISPMIGEPHPRLEFRPTSSRIVPYYRFALVDADHPNLITTGTDNLTIILGPTSNDMLESLSIQFMIHSLIGAAAIGKSEIPFRTL